MKVYYQPILTEQEHIELDFPSFCVYRNYENAREDFPNHKIGAYTEGDIEEPTIIDDVDGRTETFYVDVPNSDPTNEEWINIESFKTKDDAIAFAQKHYNADDNGMVSLISRS